VFEMRPYSVNQPSGKEILMRALRLVVVAALVVAALTAVLPAAAPALEVGQKAPDFSLPGPGNKPVKLTDLTAKGPVVLYTFIQAFTGT
jgi:AhpC/TSA family